MSRPTHRVAAGFLPRATSLLHQYVRFRFVEGPEKFVLHIRKLPREERRLAWLGVVILAILVVGTPILVTLTARPAALIYEGPQGEMRTISPLALAAALTVFVAAVSYVLAGATRTPGGLWILAATLYLYLFIPIGLVHGRTYLHLLPLLLPVALAGLAADCPRWAKLVTAALSGSLVVWFLPFPAAWRSVWYVVWAAATAILILAQALVGRLRWRSASLHAALSAVITGGYVAAATSGGGAAVASALHVALDIAVGFLNLLWFVLGAAFVTGALALGKFIQTAVDTAAPAKPRWLLVAGIALIVVWVAQFPTRPAVLAVPPRTAGVALLAVLSGVLVLRWRLMGLNQQWTTGWLVTTVAALAAVRMYVSFDVADFLTRDAETTSLIMFAFAISWNALSQIPQIPAATGSFTRPSLLLLYLGTVLLIGAASFFGLAADSRFFQELVILQQYKGSISLWIPIGLLLALRSWPGFPPVARRRVLQGFFLGALVAVPAFLVRSAWIALPWTPVFLAAMALVTIALTRLPELRGGIRAAAGGLAVAFGFAVSYTQLVLVELLQAVVMMVASVAGIPQIRGPIRDAGVLIRDWISTVGGTDDPRIYFALAPALVGAVSLLVGWMSARLAPARIRAETDS